MDALYLEESQAGFEVYPERSKCFDAFRMPISNVNAVIIGQDPYPKGQAIGIAFASYDETPSLRKMEEAIKNYLKIDSYYLDSTLVDWLEAGVLLLNASLSVRADFPNSHTEFWKPIMMEVLKELFEHKPNVPYYLWGTKAQKLFEAACEKNRFTPDKYYYAEHPAFAARKSKAYTFDGVGELTKIIYGKASE